MSTELADHTPGTITNRAFIRKLKRAIQQLHGSQLVRSKANCEAVIVLEAALYSPRVSWSHRIWILRAILRRHAALLDGNQVERIRTSIDRTIRMLGSTSHYRPHRSVGRGLSKLIRGIELQHSAKCPDHVRAARSCFTPNQIAWALEFERPRPR